MPDDGGRMRWDGILLGIAVTLAIVWLANFMTSTPTPGTLEPAMLKFGRPADYRPSLQPVE